MRLLQVENSNNISLVECVGNNIPPYAILSHTWGEDEEEVSFKEVAEGITTTTKDGYCKIGHRKIRFCREQATKDGLKHFWVDTCCIDKSSSAELSEAINSMFYWYQRAAKCYVYLSDVSSSGRTNHAFQRSRWFTRGWTLQELIAPTYIEFFSLEGERIGDRDSLIREIAEITGISIQALQGRPLCKFSVAERISWAEGRETKREEDAAYSLLGIFGIHMPHLYGEGRHNAFKRLRREIEESMKDNQFTSFTFSATETAEPARELHKYHIPFDNLRTLEHEHQFAGAQQRVLDGLRFPQIQERRHQIYEAHEETYQWILRSVSDRSQQWDNLIVWLSSPTESKRIYWIYGKPGSGKSTIMRFLDRNVITPEYMLPWTKNRMVLSAQYFFWSPGSKLQKSVAGLLRTLLTQLLEKQPLLIPQVINQRNWSAAQTPGNHPIEWTNADLQHALYEYILRVRNFAKVFLLIDGLDELDGSEEAPEELIGLLVYIASLDNVKICVSSRPWNIFRDAFGEFPQLRLEDLTHDDIGSYAKAQLHSHVRFRFLYRRDQTNAESLIFGITQKASGVFLWVRLVIRELLTGLRDGDDIHMLQKKLDGLTGDLNQYFRRLMDSISPQQRQEASVFLQIALHEEHDFATLHPLRLIDLSFIDQGRPDFITNSQYNFASFDLTDREALAFRLDSTIRRINGRCMGLLECHYDPSTVVYEDDSDLIILPPAEGLGDSGHKFQLERVQSPESLSFRSHNFFLPSGLTIQFLHRSCRDFLLTSEVQNLLHEYTQGRYDARMFLLHARISQFMSLAIAGAKKRLALSLASYFLCSFARPSYKYTPICTNLAAIIQPMLEGVIQNSNFEEAYWYIHPSVVSWYHERSSFLTLAIDFDLSYYVQMHLTPESVKKKFGRPILDYILRPRFTTKSRLKFGNQRPNLEFLRTALSFGADPNELYGESSVWALFLCFLADIFTANMEEVTRYEYSATLELLIRAGATAQLPKSWLSHRTNYKRYSNDFQGHGISPEERFSYRWPAAEPTTGGTLNLESEPWFAVSNLLEHFRSHLGSNVDTLRGLLNNRNTVLV